MKQYYVYILASSRNGTLYTGVTNDIFRRVEEHKARINKRAFSSKYCVVQLVFYEEFLDIEEAIYREKCIKKWRRAWKLQLIEEYNPEWRDLYEDFLIV